MNATSPAATRPLTLDDVILLNDAIQGLIAAGVPLEAGLSGFAARAPGRLRAVTARLAERIRGGMPLDQALDAEGGALPAEYRVVIAAGLRCGRFDAALAGVAQYAASLRELRAGLRRAVIYPGVVCALAFALLVAVFAYLVPLLLNNLQSVGLERAAAYSVLQALQQTVAYWGLGIPALVLLMVLGQSVAGRRGGSERSAARLYLGLWRWLPGVRSVLRAAHWSRFSHLLAILVESGVPYVQAAKLSAAAVGEDEVIDAIERASEPASGGRSLADALAAARGMPPLLRWLMVWGEQESQLAPALREAAVQYEQRALFRAELVQRLAPLVIVALVGGSITAVYALTVFVPLTSMWEGLASGG